MNTVHICSSILHRLGATCAPILIGLLLLSAAANRLMTEASATPTADQTSADEADEATHNPRNAVVLVRLTPAEMQEFGVEVSTAAAGDIEVFISVPGEIRPNGDQLAHIAPRYAGIVTEVRAHIGDSVQRGDVLAIVESDESLVPYELKTLIAGTIIQKHITLGEAVSRDNPAYEIANLSSVWIDLTIYQRDLNSVRTKQPVQIFTGHGPVLARGVISYITPVVNEETRTATARVVLPNADGSWRPGMFVTAKIRIANGSVRLVVPTSAVLTWNEQQVVFVEEDDGFEPRAVQTGRVGEESVEILTGLVPGDRFVSKGGFTLKAELGKAAFGDGHGH